MTRTLTVEAVHMLRRVATLSDGTQVPVTELFDADGDETNDPEEATAFICGTEGSWWVERMADYTWDAVPH